MNKYFDFLARRNSLRTIFWLIILLTAELTIFSAFVREGRTYCPVHVIKKNDGRVFFSYDDNAAAADAFSHYDDALDRNLDPLETIAKLPTVHVISNRYWETLYISTNRVREVHVEHFIDHGHQAYVSLREGEDVPDRCWCGRKRRITQTHGYRDQIIDTAIIFCDECDRYVYIAIE